MKIMQLCFTKMVNSAGGAEKVLANLSNYFSANYDVIDVGCDENIGKPFYKLNDNVKWVNLGEICDIKIPVYIKCINELVKVTRKFGLRLEYPRDSYVRKQIIKSLKQLISDEKPDVVICYEERSLVAIKEAGFDLNKAIAMFHTNSKLALSMFSDKQKDVLNKVKYIQVLLNADKEFMHKQGYKNTICIANIVPIFDTIANVKDNKTIVCVGRLNKKTKRQHLLIEAFSKITSKYPDWEVHFYGDDADPASYKQELIDLISKYNLKNKCILKGKTNRIPEALQKASIFAFPSAYEGFSLALTEGMGIGLPAVAFKSCVGNNELIVNDSNGILVDDSVDSLALALEGLMNDEDKRVKYGLQAKEDMKSYTAEKICKKWDDLFLTLK